MFRLGPLELQSNLFLSPLAGYTNLPFRLVIREIGGVDLCTTDLVNARSLLERNKKALKLIETNDRDRPLAVQLFGYEALGLEFARLLIGVRPDLSSILDDELTHVGFFEREIGKILAGDPAAAGQAQMSARAWWRKIPKTVDRYVEDVSLLPVRAQLREGILCALQERFRAVGLQTTGT